MADVLSVLSGECRQVRSKEAVKYEVANISRAIMVGVVTQAKPIWKDDNQPKRHWRKCQGTVPCGSDEWKSSIVIPT